MTPTQILVPHDFSPHADHALAYATELAKRLDATVHVVHAIGIPTFGAPELGLAFTAATIDKLVADSQAALDRITASHRNSARVGKVLVRTGDARDMILQVAEELGADLVVMGTHGRRGLSRALLGSVAETVVRTSPIPVLTIRAAK